MSEIEVWRKCSDEMPRHEQKVWYLFDPLPGDIECFPPTAFPGIYDAEDRCFVSRSGFCDKHDAPMWRPRLEGDGE